jgi:hypothetical protein
MKAITILSYCDTKNKKEILQSLIKRLKIIYPDRIILVYSHYSGVENKYYEDANYYIYDYSNPVSPKKMADWVYIPQINKKFYRFGEDFGLAVLQMIKRASLFLESIEVESSLFLNYDMDLDNISNISMIDISENLVDHVGLFSNWGGIVDEFSLCCFWLDIKRIGRDFFNSITKEKYLSYDPTFTAEKTFYHIIKESLGEKCISVKNQLDGKISGVSRKLPDVELNKYFETILASKDKTTQIKNLAIWDCKVPIENISIDINGCEYFINNDLENKYFLFSKLPDVDINEIKITKVNSIPLEDTYTMESLDERYWQKNHHE